MLPQRQEAAQWDSPRKLGGWSGLTRESTTQTLPGSWPRVPGGSRAGADSPTAGSKPALPQRSASPPVTAHPDPPGPGRPGAAGGRILPAGTRGGRPCGRRLESPCAHRHRALSRRAGPGREARPAALRLRTAWGGSGSGFPLRGQADLPGRGGDGRRGESGRPRRTRPPPAARGQVWTRSHAPGRPTPALPDRALFDRGPAPSLPLPARVSVTLALFGGPRGSDQGKGKGTWGRGWGGWKGRRAAKAEAADGQTAKALSLLPERERASEKKKQDGG